MYHRGEEMRLFLIVGVVFLSCGSTKVMGQSRGDSGINYRIDAGDFKISEQDWPWWRGALRDGSVADARRAPMNWSDTKNVAWKAPVVGRGHGSPTVLGQQAV